MTIVPFATWRPVPSHGKAMAKHLGLVLHVQVGNNSPYGWFSNPKNNASSHWWISKTGVLEQYVDAGVTAWAQASGNSNYNSVETEGYPTESLTDAQIQTLAALYRWGHDTYGWPYTVIDAVGQSGFGWHGMGGSAWGSHPGCPGNLRKAQRQQILNLAQGTVIPTPPTPIPPPVNPPSGDWTEELVMSLPVMNFNDTKSLQGSGLVDNIQGLLCGTQYGPAHCDIDNQAGPKTLAAVKAFQKMKGLSDDGKVGKDTWTALITH